MKPDAVKSVRNAPETKAKIVAAAQLAFSEKGYSQTGMRDVAERAGVAHSLILRYFGTKANLFGEALKASLAASPTRVWDRSQFGARVTAAIDDPTAHILSPAMVALAIGDDDARGVAAKILAEETIGQIAAWLGGPRAEVRATNLLSLSIGHAIFSRHLGVQVSAETRQASSRWMARVLQDLIDGTEAHAEPSSITPSSQSGA